MRSLLALALAALLGLAVRPATAADPILIGAVLSYTGPSAPLGMTKDALGMTLGGGAVRVARCRR